MAAILIVEDNPANLKLARLVLERAGHRVLAASDAQEGLATARDAKPDLILMDVQLPDMDGLTATARLKSDPETSAIPVVALTAFAMKGDEERIRAAGCDGYLSKPFRYPELLAVIERLALLP
jgi:two-component system cell cycle response regulator DivK